MKRFVLLLFSSAFFSSATLSQSSTNFQKECLMSGGIGLSGATQNTTKLGQDIWFQLDYKFSKNFSVATEFENMGFKTKGYYKDLPRVPNEIVNVENNFSLLIKYHFPSRSALKIVIASGWTYATVQSQYYNYTIDSTGYDLMSSVTSFNDYRIPLLIEFAYPISGKLNIGVRVKCNLNSQNGSTCSGGIGLSLKL